MNPSETSDAAPPPDPNRGLPSDITTDGPGQSDATLVLPPEEAVAPGGVPQRLGRYELRDRLGQGGMGIVYKAWDPRMERWVAIKVLPVAASQDDHTSRRFRQEIRAAAQLSHTNLVAAYDTDESQGRHFLVLELVAGQDLATLLHERGPLPCPLVIDCIRQAARGLDYAHRKQITHRDVKPSNIMLGNDGVVKVLDLGLARLTDSLAPTNAVSITGAIMGTASFMSPEQARDPRSADPRSDIYSLGCTLYTLLVNEPPFTRETCVEELLAHQTAPVPSLRVARPDVPEALDAIYQRMLAKSPENRYASMADFLQALDAAFPSGAGSVAHREAGVAEESETQLLARLEQAVPDASSSPLEPPPQIEDPIAAMRERAERYRERIRERVVAGELVEAAQLLQRLAAIQEEGTEEYAAWAQHELPRVEAALESLRRQIPVKVKAANQSYSRHDYVAAQQTLLEIPEGLRDDTVNQLLTRSTSRAEEVARLAQEIELDLQTENYSGLPTKLKRLHELQPQHPVLQAARARAEQRQRAAVAEPFPAPLASASYPSTATYASPSPYRPPPSNSPNWPVIGGVSALVVLAVVGLLVVLFSGGEGDVQINLNLSNVEVFIDDQPISPQRLSQPIKLPSGSHRLAVKRDGKTLQEMPFVINARDTLKLQVGDRK